MYVQAYTVHICVEISPSTKKRINFHHKESLVFIQAFHMQLRDFSKQMSNLDVEHGASLMLNLHNTHLYDNVYT